MQIQSKQSPSGKLLGATTTAVALALAMMLPAVAQAEDVTPHLTKPNSVTPHAVTSPASSPVAASPDVTAPDASTPESEVPTATAPSSAEQPPVAAPSADGPVADGPPKDPPEPQPAPDSEPQVKDPPELGQLRCVGGITVGVPTLWNNFVLAIFKPLLWNANLDVLYLRRSKQRQIAIDSLAIFRPLGNFHEATCLTSLNP